jgi:Bacterial PH domain
MRLPTPRRLGNRSALDAMAHEFRGARGSDRDEILAARQALRRAEKFYDRAIARAQRDLAIARAPEPIAAYGHRVVLYDDRLSTPHATHALVSAVRARVRESSRRPGHVELAIDGPDWREVVQGDRKDEETLRRLAMAIDRAAREADSPGPARRPETDAAEGRLAAARVERLGIEEARPLLDRLTELTEEGERVLDMAPAISTGHDGVLVVTDRRLLFVGLRHKLLLPYERIASVATSGKLFRANLIVWTASGKTVIGGLDPSHATEIAALTRRRIPERPAIA